MKEFWNTIQLIFSAVGGWLGYFLGGMDGLMIALVIFVILDYVTGIMCAINDRSCPAPWALKDLSEGAHLRAGRHRQFGRRVCAGSGGSASHGGDLLLPVQ